MNMKRVLLASSALALLAGAPGARADGLYVSVFGGANWLEDSSGAAGPYTSFNMDADTGFVLGGAIGTGLDNWQKGLRIELEASYRRNDVGGLWGTYLSSGPIDANFSTFAMMANVWYEHDMGWKVKPYVGGGVGWARTHLDGAFITTAGSTNTVFDVTDDGFAWQLGAGLNYEAAPGVDVGLGYRYFDGPDVAPFFLGPRVNNENHSVLVNLKIDIN